MKTLTQTHAHTHIHKIKWENNKPNVCYQKNEEEILKRKGNQEKQICREWNIGNKSKGKENKIKN